MTSPFDGALGQRTVLAARREGIGPPLQGTLTGTSRYALKPDPYSSHSLILRWLGEGNGQRLLDVGAADALLSRKFTENGWRVTAIEGDPEVARAGSQHCERMITANLDREIPALEGQFDAIVYADVLEHLVDPLRVLSEIDRHLAPEGLVILSVPNVAHLYIRLLLLCGRFDYVDRGILDRTHLRFFTARSLRSLLANAGLVIERFTATPVPLYQVLPESWHTPWLAATHAVNAVIARSLPRLLGYQFIVLTRAYGGAAGANSKQSHRKGETPCSPAFSVGALDTSCSGSSVHARSEAATAARTATAVSSKQCLVPASGTRSPARS
jgi:2-polyprenyl-3-methyl-5-hydroxy-6-metoxy-1,4-benzoquinol methylase